MFQSSKGGTRYAGPALWPSGTRYAVPYSHPPYFTVHANLRQNRARQPLGANRALPQRGLVAEVEQLRAEVSGRNPDLTMEEVGEIAEQINRDAIEHLVKQGKSSFERD